MSKCLLVGHRLQNPSHFYFMRGHSLVELTEHDNSVADIMVHNMYIYVLQQQLHPLCIMFTDNKWMS